MFYLLLFSPVIIWMLYDFIKLERIRRREKEEVYNSLEDENLYDGETGEIITHPPEDLENGDIHESIQLQKPVLEYILRNLLTTAIDVEDGDVFYELFARSALKQEQPNAELNSLYQLSETIHMGVVQFNFTELNDTNQKLGDFTVLAFVTNALHGRHDADLRRISNTETLSYHTLYSPKDKITVNVYLDFKRELLLI